MEGHYTFLSHLPFPENGQKLLAGAAVAVVLLLAGRAASSRLAARSGTANGALLPEPKMSLFTFFDFFVEAFVSYQDSILGKENRKYLPVCGGLFMLVLFINLLGLVPGMPAATTSPWVTCGLGLLVVMTFTFYGIKEQGLWHYIAHFFGPVLVLAPLVFPLELLSTFVLRPLTLNLRLFWNINADHIVLGIFTDMTKVVVPVAFYALGTFVCFMQAFIFSTLTMVYILLATMHEEEGHEAGNH